MDDERRRLAVRSPLGDLVASLDRDGRIVGLVFAEGNEAAGVDVAAGGVQGLIDDWFASGELPAGVIAWPRASDFQRQVWQAAMAVGRGATCSYRELAEALGRPRAVRAVAAALAANPVLLLVPCHRVLGSDGSLRGYAGGLARKRRLLTIEGALPG